MSKPAIDDITVSVVIPAYQSDHTIEETLDSITAQKGDFRYEVITVNSSNDSTPFIVREKFPTVKLVQLQTRTPSGAARNIGADQAGGRFLVYNSSWIISPC